VLGAGEDEMLVDLVGDDDRVELVCQLTDQGELVEGEHLPGRVVRRVDQHELGAGGERRAQFVAVEAVLTVGTDAGSQHDRPGDRIGERDACLVAVVHRLEHDDLVAGVEHAEQRPRQRFGGAGGHQHLGIGVDVETVEAALMLGDRLPQGWNPWTRWVLVDARTDRLDRSIEHLARAVGVGEPLPEVDRAGLHSQCRHLGEDRGAEPGEPTRERRARESLSCHARRLDGQAGTLCGGTGVTSSATCHVSPSRLA
jgi:hypothetical protein